MEKIKTILPYAIILLLLVLLFKKCDDEKKAIDLYVLENQKVKTYKNNLGTITSTVQALELTQKQLKQMVLQKDDSLKKLVSEFNKAETIVKWKTKYIRDTILVPFEVLVDCDFDITGKFRGDKWIGFDYNINNSHLSLMNVSVPNETTIITGTKRNWIFGKQYLTTDITHSNPYIKTEQVQSIVIPVQQEWYNSKYVWFLAGLGGGLLLK